MLCSYNSGDPALLYILNKLQWNCCLLLQPLPHCTGLPTVAQLNTDCAVFLIIAGRKCRLTMGQVARPAQLPSKDISY